CSLSFALPVHCFTSPLHFFFQGPPPTEIYTLSLHDSLPILLSSGFALAGSSYATTGWAIHEALPDQISVLDLFNQLVGQGFVNRSEEHTSELQSRGHLVCRLLLEKKYFHSCCWMEASRFSRPFAYATAVAKMR